MFGFLKNLFGNKTQRLGVEGVRVLKTPQMHVYKTSRGVHDGRRMRDSVMRDYNAFVHFWNQVVATVSRLPESDKAIAINSCNSMGTEIAELYTAYSKAQEILLPLEDNVNKFRRERKQILRHGDKRKKAEIAQQLEHILPIEIQELDESSRTLLKRANKLVKELRDLHAPMAELLASIERERQAELMRPRVTEAAQAIRTSSIRASIRTDHTETLDHFKAVLDAREEVSELCD